MVQLYVVCNRNTLVSKIRIESKRIEKDDTTSNHKKAGMVVLISDKIEFKVKRMLLEIKGQFIMIKCSIHQETIIIINTYEPNNRIPKYVKQKQIEYKIENLTIIVIGFNTLT